MNEEYICAEEGSTLDSQVAISFQKFLGCVLVLSVYALKFYLCIFGCAGSSLLPGLLSSCGDQAALQSWRLGFSQLRSAGSRAGNFIS